MKIRLKKILVVILTFLLILNAIPLNSWAMESKLELSEEYSNQLTDLTPAVYGECRTSFLDELADGGYQAVIYDDGILYVENFDSNWNSTGVMSLELELPIWGGLFLGEEYNYVVCGQKYDSTLEDGGEVYRIIKYDKNFSRIDSISFSSADTYTATPFYCGNVSVDEHENQLTVYTSRLRLDGHQSNIALRINTDDMTVRDTLGMGSSPDIHTSHSLRQIVKYDEGTEVYVDLTDGNPVRSTYIQYGNVKMPMMQLSGTDGDNVTDAEVSGLEISDTHYFVVGSYLNFEEQNIYLSCINKETSEVTNWWLTTSTAFSSEVLYGARIVKMTDDRYVVMWNSASIDGIQYVIIDQEGNRVCQLKEACGVHITDCEPIFSNGKIIWLSVKEGVIVTEMLTDFAETGEFKWVYPIVEGDDIWDGTSDVEWYNDTDTEFTISTPEQLAGLSELVAEGNTFEGKTVTLNNDLFLNDTSYEYDWPSILEWNGTFNGNGHIIYNMYQEDEDGGLFETIGENGIVKAVTMAQGIFYTGGCIADVNKGIIAFCNSRSLVYGDEYSRRLADGGICDENQNLVYGCTNYGKVIGDSVGGIVGINKTTLSVVSQCKNLGSVAAYSAYSSGIIACNYGWVYNCYSRGVVTAKVEGNPNEAKYVSGMVGYRGNYNAGDIESCYSVNMYDSAEYYEDNIWAIGPDGIVNCYSQTSGTQDADLITVLSADEMKDASFIALLNQQTNTMLPAWVSDSNLINGGYPITVADYNYQNGIYKIQPELWIEWSGTLNMEPGDTKKTSCTPYYNEKEITASITDSNIASVTLSGTSLSVTALQEGVTYIVIHFEESDNVIGTDYRIKLVVGDPQYVSSGTCGTNVNWMLSLDGTLTISGEGAMTNFTYKSEMPWYSYIDQITSVIIEEGVTTIGDYAFYGMNELQSITIPETVTAIGAYAFKNAIAINDVTLPNGLIKLGESAFYGCTGLTSIEIPVSLWTIQPYTFKNCTALTTVIFNEGNLQKISDGAFYNTGLTKVKFPDCLSIIDVYAFKNCSSLASIQLGNGLIEIREAVFYGCPVKKMDLPEGITKVGSYAFKNCTKLVSVELPDTLTSVGEASFYACTSLADITLPDTVTTIGDYAFRKCTGLNSVEYGEALSIIGESSFYGCTGLTELILPVNVEEIKGYAFKGCTGLTSVTLPDFLVTLGESAFYGCTGLDEITIPVNVESIGDYCFSRSTGLKTVTFQGDVPDIGSAAFSKVTATVYYPADNETWTDDVMQNYGGTLTWEVLQ